MSHLIDLSHPISELTPPFPGDPAVEITVLQQTAESEDRPRKSLNCSRLAMCVHCGTHLDAPFHFFGNGRTIDQVSLDACIGPAVRVRLFDGADSARSKVIEAADLAPHAQAMRQYRRALFETGWDSRWRQPDYFHQHPVFSRAAARLIVECGVLLIGVDFPSVDQRPNEAHLELLGNGVLILENLTNLDRLPDGEFELIAGPLALSGRDGSPVRALARVTR